MKFVHVNIYLIFIAPRYFYALFFLCPCILLQLVPQSQVWNFPMCHSVNIQKVPYIAVRDIPTSFLKGLL